MKHLQVFTDGGSRGNPGLAGIGGVIYEVNGKEKKKVFEFSKKIGIATNNDAEYKAVIFALEWIKKNLLEVEKIEFFLDSSLVVNQLNGFFKVKKGKLREYILKIRILENEIGTDVSYKLVKREENKEADRLVNRALDQS